MAIDLKKTAALPKADEIAFDSLAAAALATKDVEIIREYWLSDRGLVSICSAIIAGISGLVTVILIYKINRLSTVIVTLQRFQGGREASISFSTPAFENEDVRFSFWRSTSSTITSATATAHEITEIWFVYKIELIMTGIVLAIIIYGLFKSFKQIQNCPQKGFQFALEIIDRNQKSLIVPLDVFPGQIMFVVTISLREWKSRELCVLI